MSSYAKSTGSKSTGEIISVSEIKSIFASKLYYYFIIWLDEVLKNIWYIKITIIVIKIFEHLPNARA